MIEGNSYKLQLNTLGDGEHKYSFRLSNEFFNGVDSNDILGGDVEVDLSLTRNSEDILFNFNFKGEVVVECGRCLEEMEVAISAQNTLKAKIGAGYNDEEITDEVVEIPLYDQEIDLTWYLYEFVVLSLPLKTTHPEGECNEDMITLLTQHQVDEFNDVEDNSRAVADQEIELDGTIPEEVDPRWAKLKELLDNN